MKNLEDALEKLILDESIEVEKFIIKFEYLIKKMKDFGVTIGHD